MGRVAREEPVSEGAASLGGVSPRKLLLNSPSWKEVELEIKKVKEELMHPNELVMLAQEREQVWEDYQAMLLY